MWCGAVPCLCGNIIFLGSFHCSFWDPQNLQNPGRRRVVLGSAESTDHEPPTVTCVVVHLWTALLTVCPRPLANFMANGRSGITAAGCVSKKSNLGPHDSGATSISNTFEGVFCCLLHQFPWLACGRWCFRAMANSSNDKYAMQFAIYMQAIWGHAADFITNPICNVEARGSYKCCFRIQPILPFFNNPVRGNSSRASDSSTKKLERRHHIA